MDRNLKTALFTGVFVALINILTEYLLTSASTWVTTTISVLAIAIGWSIGRKLFSPKKETGQTTT